MATQTEATTLLQQFIKKEKKKKHLPTQPKNLPKKRRHKLGQVEDVAVAEEEVDSDAHFFLFEEAFLHFQLLFFCCSEDIPSTTSITPFFPLFQNSLPIHDSVLTFFFLLFLVS